MKISVGTKSVLFGAHQFILHPICLAIAWKRLYGWPKQWQLLLCFFCHDIGYWGKAGMDTPEGETHPEYGARLVRKITGSDEWWYFCLFHSRHYSKQKGQRHSRLCVADKLAFCIMPKWYYILSTRLTGELKEYMKNGESATCPPCTWHQAWCLQSSIPRFWHAGLYSYMIRWVAKHHKDEQAQDLFETSRGRTRTAQARS